MADHHFKVFVYGTLKRGEPNNDILTDHTNGYCVFLSSGVTSQTYPLAKYNIPFLIDQPGTGNQIAGEIYSIDDKMLSRLDLLEDYPSFYDRKLMNIDCDNDQISCWVYILNKFPKELQNLPLISDYKNTPELCYQKSCQHVSNILSD